MNKHYALARLRHINDLAIQLEVTSRNFYQELLDELEAEDWLPRQRVDREVTDEDFIDIGPSDVVDSDDAPENH